MSEPMQLHIYPYLYGQAYFVFCDIRFVHTCMPPHTYLYIHSTCHEQYLQHTMHNVCARMYAPMTYAFMQHAQSNTRKSLGRSPGSRHLQSGSRLWNLYIVRQGAVALVLPATCCSSSPRTATYYRAVLSHDSIAQGRSTFAQGRSTFAYVWAAFAQA